MTYTYKQGFVIIYDPFANAYVHDINHIAEVFVNPLNHSFTYVATKMDVNTHQYQK